MGEGLTYVSVHRVLELVVSLWKCLAVLRQIQFRLCTCVNASRSVIYSVRVWVLLCDDENNLVQLMAACNRTGQDPGHCTFSSILMYWRRFEEAISPMKSIFVMAISL